MLELPLNSIPERFAIDKDFQTRASTFINRTIKYFDRFPSVIAFGSGGGFLGNSKEHNNFITLISNVIKENAPNKLTDVSSVSLPELVPQVDLFGFELYSFNFNKITQNLLTKPKTDSLLYFISEATYPTYKGSTDGYLNEYSFEGQAKFFENVIKFNDEKGLDGFILNSMYNYSGNYSPFYTGFNESNSYNIGILSNDSNASRISYNLIKSKLLGGSRVSIPIGSKTEDSNFFFVIAALVISAIIAMLINSKRKFREDAQRALIRPYNFYADIRDQRILSGFHSSILMFLLAGSNALLSTILLHYLKNNILLEKSVIAFGSYKFSEIISYFAWHPLYAFVYLYVISILLFLIISFIIHSFSFFVKTRVLFSSVYYTAIWAFLPLTLLLPIEAALYKLLQTNNFNQYIYIFLFIYLIWNIQRLIKGIYVIFDVRPIYVYLVSTAFIILIGIGIVTYIQYTSLALDYITVAFKQYF
jgi:beta-galactosidase